MKDYYKPRHSVDFEAEDREVFDRASETVYRRRRLKAREEALVDAITAKPKGE